MKKIIYSAMAVAMLATTSCKDDFAESFVGEEATVEFSISTPEIGTRAYSDGTTATHLQYAVYDAAGNQLTALTKTDGKINGSTTVTLDLTTGETYSVIFWAAAEGAPYTVDFDKKTMTVNYTGAKSNDESRDAFYKYHTFTVSGAQTETIELKRPFAQLNIGTSDYAAATATNYNPTQSKVTVKNIYNTLNLATGAVSGEEEVVFGYANINRGETFPVVGYEYLAMNYLLVGTEKETIEIEFGYEGTNDAEHTRTVGSVPVQRNYRTNIYGKLLTSTVDVNVEIEPDFNEPAHEAEKLYIAAACGGTVTLTEDVELPKSLIVADDISMIINLNGHSIINKSGSTELEEGDGIIVYGDLTINGEGTVQGNTRAVWARGNDGAKVRINGGHYIGAVDNDGCEVIYASGNGKIDIYGGTFEAVNQDKSSFAAPQYAVLNLHGNGAAGCDIKVYGGSFKNFNPADNISENPKHNFCAEGYTATKVGDNYIVAPNGTTVATGLEDVKDAFAEGGNIVLADDIEFDKIIAVEPDKEVYLNLNGKTITVDENTTSNTLFYVKEGGKLIIDGDGTINLGAVSTMAVFAPYGELVIENGTFIRDEVTVVTNKTTGLFMGAKSTASNVTINGGYFDAGYYNSDADDIEDILAGTKSLEETAEDIAKRGNSGDNNQVRVALKDNVSVLLNHSGYGVFKVYGGTFVGANPAWGDEGCMLPTTPNYLRPWSYYQGALLDGQTFHEDGIVLPDGYTITKSTHTDGRPIYTVEYSK